MEEFIREALQAHDLRLKIYALALFFERLCDTLQSFIPETAVIDANKGLMAAAFCAATGLKAKSVLATGDSLTDIELMDPRGPGVLILPRRDKDPDRVRDRLAHLDTLFPRVGAFLIGDTLEPLVEMRRS